MTRVVFIRHAEPLVAIGTPGAQWPLTNEGKGAARLLGERVVGRSPVALVWASPERKALQTAESAFPSGPTRVRDELGEVRKPWYATTDDLREAVSRYVGGDAVEGWERHEDVTARLNLLQADISAGERLVVVSHGVVLTTWLALYGVLDDPFAFWSDLRTPDAWELDLEEKSLERII
jgi:broad specificity phosphatase PhoE